jgi:hypothetical protein
MPFTPKTMNRPSDEAIEAADDEILNNYRAETSPKYKPKGSFIQSAIDIATAQMRRNWRLTLNRHEHKHCSCEELYAESRAAQPPAFDVKCPYCGRMLSTRQPARLQESEYNLTGVEFERRKAASPAQPQDRSEEK